MAETNGVTGRSGGHLLYLEAFGQERPKAVTTALQARLRRDKLIAECLAEYLQERSNVEETYVKALQKLARKPIFADSYGLALGEGMERIRRRLDTELEEITQLHDGFARRVEGEVIEVLRDRASRAGEAALRQHDSSAMAIVKDWDDAHARAAKAQGKASTSGRKGNEAAAKLAAANADLGQASTSWRQTVAPSLFQAYDQADRSRLEATKESLAKYATMQSDLGSQRLEVAARVLNDVITWELDDDVSEWLRHEGGGQGGVVEGVTGSGRGVSEMGQNRQQDAYLTPSTAAGRQQPEPAPSIHSHRERSGGLLAKLTPKLNRNRSSSHPSAYGNIDAGDRNSVYEAEPEGPTDLGRSTTSRADTTFDDSAVAGSITSSTARDKRSSFMPGLLRRKDSTSSSQPDRSRSRASMAPGSLLAPQELDSPSASTQTTPRPSMAPPTVVEPSMSGGTVVQHSVMPPSVDAEGFSVPPAGYDKQPWEGAGGNSLMDDEPNEDAAGHLRATSLAIQPTSITEGSKEREAALQRVQSQLLASKAPHTPGGVARRGTTRGRRDVRQSTLNTLSSTDDMPLSQIVEQHQRSPTAASLTPSASGLPPGAGAGPGSPGPFTDSPFSSPLKTPAAHERAMSMLSTSSSRDQLSASSPSANPFENAHGEGLRASISEVVNVMAKGGDVTRVMVTGEVALSLRLSSTAPSSVRVRLLAHDQLEKSAPNSHYLTPLPGSPGEYHLNASALAAASANGPIAVLRYHLLVSDAASPQHTDLSPVHLHPQWKCEATQTSILISYRSIPSSRLASHSSPFDEGATVLKDLTLHAPISSSHVGGVQTKPQGRYTSEHRRLQWRLDDLDLSSAEGHKVLARVAVNEASSLQPVVLKWRLPGRLISGVGVEVVGEEEDGVRLEEVVRRVEGKHLAA